MSNTVEISTDLFATSATAFLFALSSETVSLISSKTATPLLIKFAEVFTVSSETYCWHILKQESGNNCMRQIYENIGLLSVYLGAILLVVGFFMEWTDSNVFLLVALFLVIAGAVTHVIMQKRHNKY